MAKKKMKATVEVADGSGGLAPLKDHRFETGEWPVRREVPKEQADTWLEYFSAGCSRRGWNCGAMTQLGAGENSGSVTVRTGDSGRTELAVVWERKRGGTLKVRAKSAGAIAFPLNLADELFREVSERCRSAATERFFCWGLLSYDGLAWRGELWLDEQLRLGPPSQQDETALVGPRIILVLASVDGIDLMHARSAFQVLLREVSVFLSVVIGSHVQTATQYHRGWTWAADPDGRVRQSETRSIGYYETELPGSMPDKGETRPVPLEIVHRPDFSLRGIDGTRNEVHLPDDIVELWERITALPADRRRQFLQAGNLWQVAASLDHENLTTRLALMVAACESLRPPEPQYRDHIIYEVVEALLGKEKADLLRGAAIRPQDVRNAHLHRGEFHGSEFVPRFWMPSYRDPTFENAFRDLYGVAQATIIEWLRVGGTYTMPLRRSHRTWRRRLKDNVFAALIIVGAVCLGAGLGLGRLLR